MPQPEAISEREYQQDQREHELNRRDDQQGLSITMAGTSERINGLERWQIAQNGSLKRIEDKLDAHQVSTTERFDKLNNWLMTLMGTTILALAGSLLGILIHKG